MAGNNHFNGLSDSEALRALAHSSISMLMTDPHQADNPIVYVNPAFKRTTGYTSSEVMGRNCRFLQGPQTDPSDVDAIRTAIATSDEISIDIVNYRADGSAFMNRLTIAPIFDDAGDIRHFLGIQKELREIDHERRRPPGDRSMVELQHRVKNHLAMIVGLVRMQARKAGESAAFATLSRRIESLQLLYEELGRRDMGGRSRISLGDYLGRIVSAVSHLDGRPGLSVDVDTPTIYVDTEMALSLGLILSEVLTNCFQHAFADREEGRVEVRVVQTGPGGIRISVADDGVGLAEGSTWPNMYSLGGRIVTGLVDGLDGQLDVSRREKGTIVTLDVPTTGIELKQ